MRKKAVCRFGVCLLSMYLLFSNSVLSRAGEEGTEAPLAGNEGKQEEISEPELHSASDGSGGEAKPDSASDESGKRTEEFSEPAPESDVPPADEDNDGDETQKEPAIKSISISPGTAVVSRGSTCNFIAVVTGENDYNDEVAWSVSGQSSQSTFMDSNGVLNVGTDETASSLVVRAVSKQDSNFSATALATLQRTEYSVQVKASPDNGGTVSGGGSVEEGGYAVLSASPNNGFTFAGWSLNGTTVSSDSRYVADKINSDRTYVANFKSATCKINVTVNNSDAGIATESKTVNYGENLTLEAAAREGYQFDGWMENGEIISRDYKLQLNNITASRDFVAVFSQGQFSLTLSTSPVEAGAVSGQGTYNKGSNVKIIATPVSGYRFTGWTENGTVVNTNQTAYVENLSRNMELVANFEVKTYTINAGVSSLNGTISPEGKSTVQEGGEIQYTITPKGGYTVKAVYVDGKSVGAVGSYSFTDVRGNHNISVDFVAASDKGSSRATPSPEKNKTDKKDEKDEDGEEEKDKKDKPDGAGKEEEKDGQQEKEEDGLTGTLRYLDISLEEAEQMIDLGSDGQLMSGALAAGDLQVTVENDFADRGEKISLGSFEEASDVVNFDKVLGALLTRREKLEMLTGDVPVDVAFQIKDAGGERTELIVRTFEENKLPEREIGRYFEMSLTKSRLDDKQEVSVLPKKLRVVINVPEHLIAAGRDFYILRLHNSENGVTEFAELADEDDSPDTITFSTDRFSHYAIAYTDRQPERGKAPGSATSLSGSRGVVNIVVIFAIILATGITFFLVFYLVREAIARRRDRW